MFVLHLGDSGGFLDFLGVLDLWFCPEEILPCVLHLGAFGTFRGAPLFDLIRHFELLSLGLKRWISSRQHSGAQNEYTEPSSGPLRKLRKSTSQLVRSGRFG